MRHLNKDYGDVTRYRKYVLHFVIPCVVYL